MAPGKKPTQAAPPETKPAVRCAIYTRKSTDENLESSFNSLDAQREASENYIRSQQHEGWIALPDRYDDGAISGATLERPALQRLLQDVRHGKVDTIVIYKIDRLSRSLMDFTKLVEELERYTVSLVSVTQQFNTTTSMGRLTMNILLSFAQFEREVIAERIRDKIAAEKRRGRWVGGQPPLGYSIDKVNRRLVVVPDEAVVVRYAFRRFVQLRSLLMLAKDLNQQGYKSRTRGTKGHRPWDKGSVHRTLTNPAYQGLIRHKELTFPGEHEAIIDKALWGEVQEVLTGNPVIRGRATRSKSSALLKGLLKCGHCGTAMGITYTQKAGKQYRYYLCVHADKSGYDSCPVKSIPAGDVESAVLFQLRKVFQAPEILAEAFRVVRNREEEDRRRLTAERTAIEQELATLRTNASMLIQTTLPKTGSEPAGRDDPAGNPAFVSEEIVRMERQAGGLQQRLNEVTAELDMLEQSPTTSTGLDAELQTLDRIWGELFPAERERILHLLVDSITMTQDGLVLVMKLDGVSNVLAELGSGGTTPNGDERLGQNAGRQLNLQIPMQLKHRSGRKEIILPNGDAKQSSPVQESLVVAVARAHRWLALLEEGRFGSVSELAEAVGMDSSQVRRHLALTSLRPEVVREILDGREPDGVSLKGLLGGVEVVWGEGTAKS